MKDSTTRRNDDKERVMLREMAQRILRFMARATLMKYRPIVVGVTGSVGKTTTKEAIAAVLSVKYRVGSGSKNYNNEIGLPLAILGDVSPGRSILSWLSLGRKWVVSMISRSVYPEVVVLEMGVDRPGDMDYLLSIAKPDVGVVTGISASHAEYFGSLGNIAKEKGKLIRSVSKDGFALANADDSRTLAMLERTVATKIGYGFSQNATLRALHPSVNRESGEGMRFKLDYQGKIIPIRLKHVVARHHVYAILAAFGVASALKVNLLEAAKVVEDFHAPKGRMTILPGKNGSLLLDDTYNASPISVSAALETLGEIACLRKIVVLGDMLELGPLEESGHRDLAVDIRSAGVVIACLVGRRMKYLAEELIKSGFESEQIRDFTNPDDAGAFLSGMVMEGDVLLVKGSQGMRMEKVVESLLRDQQSAGGLLCRQEESWKNIPFSNP